jgi:hypothetical protein
MNLEYKDLLDSSFHPDSRVWIYQSSRLFPLPEALEIEILLKQFTAGWQSHGVPVKGAGYLFFGQFIIVMADETTTGVSGCSTDSSVRLMKEIEQRFAVSLFDRAALAFVIKDKSHNGGIQLLPLSQLRYAIENGFITGETLYFNNLVQSKEELETNWIIPVKNSWLGKRFSFSESLS